MKMNRQICRRHQMDLLLKGSSSKLKLLIAIRKVARIKVRWSLLKFSNYRLIRGSNGLTTIQLLRQHQESISQHLTNSQSPSSSPTSLSPPIHHLSLHKESSNREQSDEDMPTDLRRQPKNYDWRVTEIEIAWWVINVINIFLNWNDHFERKISIYQYNKTCAKPLS